MTETEVPMQWFYGRNGVQRGPFSDTEFGKMAADGRLLKGDLVWRQGFGEWIEAIEVTELAGHFTPGAAAGSLQSRGPPALQRFRDPTGLTRLLAGLLIVNAVYAVVSAGSGALELSLLNDIKNGLYPDDAARTAAARVSDGRQAIVAFVQVALTIAVVAVFIKWIVRSNFNVRQLGATGLRFTSKWAAGWYFIPVANLWKPYQAMSEIWRASRSPGTWATDRVGALLPLWWGLFLVDNIVGNLAGRLMLTASDIETSMLASAVALASDLVSIPAAVVAWLLVRSVCRMQLQSWRERKTTLGFASETG